MVLKHHEMVPNFQQNRICSWYFFEIETLYSLTSNEILIYVYRMCHKSHEICFKNYDLLTVPIQSVNNLKNTFYEHL